MTNTDNTMIPDCGIPFAISELAAMSGITTSKLREVAAQSTPPKLHPGVGRKWLFNSADASALLDLAKGL